MSAAALYPDVRDVRQARPAARLHARVFGRTFTADRPVGRSIAFRRAAWERVGGFPQLCGGGGHRVRPRGCGAAAGAWCRPTVRWSGTSTPVPCAPRGCSSRYGRGDGLQGDRVGLLRNGARAGAAIGAPVLLLIGGRTVRALVGLGAAAYVSLPLARLRDDPAPLRTSALVPLALALKDLSKAYGCALGLLEASLLSAGR